MSIRSILATIALTCSFLIVGALLYHPIPESNKDIVNVAIGMVLGASITGVIGHYFGTTHKEINNGTQ